MYRLIATALCSCICFGAAPAHASSRTFETRNELVVHVPKGARQVRVWFALPREDPAQTVKDLEIQSPYPHRIVRDSHNNRLLYVEASDPKAGSFEIVSSFELTRSEQTVPVDPEQTRPLDRWDLDEKKQWLESNEHVVINDRILDLSDEITQGEDNPLIAARMIYDWMLENVGYWVKEPALKSATKVGSTTYCLNTGMGNCTDFHSLYTSLARAQGIPTRVLYGSLYKPELDGQDIDASYHCWIEFFAPEVGWVPVDVEVAGIFHGSFEVTDDNRTLVSLTTADGYTGPDPEKVDYYFGNLEPRRVTWTEGGDVTLEPEPAGGPVNALPKAYVEVDGEASPEGNGWTRKLTYVEKK